MMLDGRTKQMLRTYSIWLNEPYQLRYRVAIVILLCNDKKVMLYICYESDDVVTKRNIYLKYRQKHIALTIGGAKSSLNGLKIVIWHKFID